MGKISSNRNGVCRYLRTLLQGVCFEHVEQNWAYLIKFPFYFEKVLGLFNQTFLISSGLKILCIDDICAGNFSTNLKNQMKNL